MVFKTVFHGEDRTDRVMQITKQSINRSAVGDTVSAIIVRRSISILKEKDTNEN
jgi:hypothetical protein